MLSYFYFSEGQGFILVYSIASRSTFNRLQIFQQSIFRIKRQKPIFILVGNKCDKTHEREVTKAEGVALARSFSCSFLETSAKTGHNVELLFTNLVRGMRAVRQTEVPDPQPLLKKKRMKCYIMWWTITLIFLILLSWYFDHREFIYIAIKFKYTRLLTKYIIIG